MMRNYLNNLPDEFKDLISLSRGVAAENRFKIFLVGGFVRDLIFGVRNLDLDIVVEADGISFAEALSSCLKAKLIRHRRFGTATISLRHSLKIDIATTRIENYPQPACLPVVSKGSIKDDLKRRDFSINAMAVSLNQDNYGELLDFFSGLDDLRSGKIRILHKLSFIDDPTRILRAVRFEKRYNFKIEPDTLKCLRQAVKLKMLGQVQPQRLRDELILILKEEYPLKQLSRLDKLTGLSFINPGLYLSKNIYKLLQSVHKEIAWFKKIHSAHRHLDSWLIYFMAMLDSLNLNKLQSVCDNFVFRKGEEKRILTYKKIDCKFIYQLKQRVIRPSQVFKLLNPLSYEVIILLKAKYNHANVTGHIEDFLKHYHSLRLHISGDDLYELGLRPGPDYQRFLSKVFNAKLDGRVQTKEEEIELIKKLK